MKSLRILRDARTRTERSASEETTLASVCWKHLQAFRLRLVVVIGLLVGCSGVQARAADWPTYRQNAQRTGSTPEKLKMPLKQRWVYSAPTKPRLAWAGPDGRTIELQKLKHRVKFDDTFQVVCMDNRVYFGSSVDHHVRSFDIATGREVWAFATGAGVRLAPTVWEGRVYFGSDDGYAYCVSADSGKLVWKRRPGPADEWFLGRGEMISRWPVRTGVTIYDDIAYFGAGIFPHEDVFLWAVDAKTGKTVWKRDDISSEEAGRNALSPQGYLLANEKYLVVPSARALPVCFDRNTGKQLHSRRVSWRREGVLGGFRAVLADGQIYASGPHQMVALKQETGDLGYATIPGEEIVFAGKHTYSVTGRKLQKLNRADFAKTSKERNALTQSMKSLYRKLTRPDADKVALQEQFQTALKELGALNKKGIAWSVRTTGDDCLLATKEHVFVGDEDGVEGYSTETGKRVWNQKVDGTVRGLIAANGFLFVSTTKGKVYAFADAAQESTEVIQQPKLAANPYPNDEFTKRYETAAKNILKNTNTNRGFCLVLGAGEGRLAYELAKRSRLKIYGIEPNQAKVAKAREMLSRAGLYGHRVTIHQADLGDIPYSNYFANLVVSDEFVRTGELSGNPKNFLRHVKPLGGIVYLTRGTDQITDKKVRSWVKQLASDEPGEINSDSKAVSFLRGKLEGAANWSHQYGDPNNTAFVPDTRIKGGLGVLWYGDPGPGKMVNRHEGAVGPISINGRLIVQGQTSVMAYDAYNGLFLWEHQNPGVFRTGVFQNANPSNLIGSDDSVFVMEDDVVVEIDAASGKLVRRHTLPEGKRKEYAWGYIGYRDGYLIGTVTLKKELAARLRRRGRKFGGKTDDIFAIDVKTGKRVWTYNGKSISPQTIAVGQDRIYFIDSSITSEERQAILRRDRAKLKALKGDEAREAERRRKEADVRMATAIDLKTGKKIWATSVDVTDCSDIGIGGGKLTLMYNQGTLVLGGANANGHYWRQFLKGEFKRRRLVALSAKDGKLLWAKDANYRHRPIIVESKIIAEPWAYNLFTGTQIMRKHPLTGQEVPWSMYRPGHHCGMLTACTNFLMFRSGSTGFYDLYNDSGTQHFAGHRLGCWINAIPANGLVMIPEASAGCVCQFSIASTIVMEPREARRPWAIYSSVGSGTPVERMGLNLGAPGDRKDAGGNVWLAYPRPNALRHVGLDLELDIDPLFHKGGGYKNVSARLSKIKATNAPKWVFTSQARGLKSAILPLLGKKDQPAKYTVRLFFADIEGQNKLGQRRFDVKLQGKTVLKNFDPANALEEGQTVVIREFENITVRSDLAITLVPSVDNPTDDQMPILNAIEVVRQRSTR
ncbi:MAG: PQQ-binding-like beta-propeller repeat protein [Gemmataceae bacterium]